MDNPSLFGVITTIQPPTASVRGFVDRLVTESCRLIVIGDKKGPSAYDLRGVDFWPLSRQLEAGFQLGSRLPVGHYSRKNIGYLAAIADGAACIYETDDDNAPLPAWRPRAESVESATVIEQCDADKGRWVDVYRYFTKENIWPRGLPLDEIGSSPAAQGPAANATCWAPIQQGLVDGSPDVDAIWRLTQDRAFKFERGNSVFLQSGNWCPFNSQSTWWWPAAYPLLYIPSHCPFRMCDIWRSFVAQRCVWELGAGLCFHGSEVMQERNQHNLMRDFEDEIAGYRFNKRFAAILSGLALRQGRKEVAGNFRACYEALIADGRFPPEELALVDAWLADLCDLPSSEW